MVKIIRSLVLFICITLITSCAQVVAPTGGEKDVTPPEILALSPEDLTVNFSSQTFQIEFDEFVVLKNLKEQLLVSPPLKYKLETKIKGKKLIFEIKDTLKPNTTYVFNFGNAIVDLNEGNPVQNFQYVFSTGPILDSLTLSGRVLDAFDLVANKEAILLLYPENAEDSAIAKELPVYISRSNEEGFFNFSNLKRGNYRVFALNDKNDNYKYDRADEGIGFLDESVNLSDTANALKLYTFTKKNEKQFIEKQELEGNKLSLTFKIIPKKIKLELLDTTITDLIKHIEYKNELVGVWLKETGENKFTLAVSENDFNDTIQVKTKVTTDTNALILEKEIAGKQNYFEPIKITFNRILNNLDTSLISITDTSLKKVDYTIKIDSTSKYSVLIQFPIKEEAIYIFTALPNAFTDIYQNTNDSLNSFISFNTAEEFGNLSIKVKGLTDLKYILQLTDDNGKVLKEIFETDSLYNFKNLTAGSYGLKIIHDQNQNKEWDSGDFFRKKQAEKVIIYDEPIGIRQNWDKEIIWVIEY